jgi:hypothetical protein
MSSESGNSTGQVVDLTAVRARRQRQPRTVILRAANLRADAEVHRHIGVNDALHLADLHDVLVTSFGLGDHRGSAPWHFSTHEDRDERLDAADELHHHLAEEGDSIVYHFGLWDIIVTAVESYLRDDGTPRALCVGGSGAFGDTEFDLAAINAELTGTATIRDVLAATAPAVRRLIDRSAIFDFVPLLQALDLTREVGLPPEVTEVLAELPVETDPPSRDAFWSVVLALACMSDELLGNHVLETTMSALGWQDDDGSPLTSERIRELCADSLGRLANLGAYGPDALSPVDRLDIYRELLRA